MRTPAAARGQQARIILRGVKGGHDAVGRSRRDEAEPREPLRLQPFTERILASLPGPRSLWFAVWALIPWLNAGANLLFETGSRSAVWEQSGVVVILNYAALSFAMVVTLLGAERLARRMEALEATTSKALSGVPRQAFRAINSVHGPLAARCRRCARKEGSRDPRLARPGRNLGLGDRHRDERCRDRMRPPDTPALRVLRRVRKLSGRQTNRLFRSCGSAQRVDGYSRFLGARASVSKSPVSCARTTACTRSRSLSFWSMWVMCVLTVASLM
jgi:hypothetical protein